MLAFYVCVIRLRVPVDVVGEQVDEAGKTRGPSMLVVARRAKLMWGVPNRDGSMGLTFQGIHGSTAADVSLEMQETFPEVCLSMSPLESHLSVIISFCLEVMVSLSCSTGETFFG